jgi:hypothetical protein
MPNQCAATNLSPIIRLLPEAPPQDRIDSVPAMRRELSLLRIELERLRALENEARKTNELLVGYIDRLIDNRDEWRREAERLSALCSIYQDALDSRLVWSWAQIRKFCHCE